MTIETASYLSQLDATYPVSGDLKSEGDNHLRLIKSAVKATFPNLIAAPVTPSTTELNYVTGVTSAIQTQINAEITARAAADTAESNARIAADALKANLSGGNVITGTQDLTGAVVNVATQVTGDSSSKAASTAFVTAAAFVSALPGQSGHAGQFVTTDGNNASWVSINLVTDITANATLTKGISNIWPTGSGMVLQLPASPATRDMVTLRDPSNTWATYAPTLSGNGQTIETTLSTLPLNISGVQFSVWFNGSTWKLA